MIELLYPVDELAPMLPEFPGVKGANAKILFQPREFDEASPIPMPEIFPVVTDDGTVIARATREYCHSGSKLLHPVVHLHLIDRQERIYLQKRSMKKDIQPGKWDTAVGGHVIYGESLMEALYRESYEELALTDYNPIYIGTYCYDTGRDMEFVTIFAAVGHFEVTPDMDEVDEGKWLTVEQIQKMAAKGQLTPNFHSEFTKIKDKLLALL